MVVKISGALAVWGLVLGTSVTAQPIVTGAVAQPAGGGRAQIVVTGNGFGVRPDHSPTQPFLNVAWHGFDDQQLDGGGWTFQPGCYTNASRAQWSVVPGGRVAGGSFAKKVFIDCEYGSVGLIQTGTTGRWFISFWMMQPAGNQGGKFFRMYGNPADAMNWYLGSSAGEGLRITGVSEAKAISPKWTCYNTPDPFKADTWARVDIEVRDDAVHDEISVYMNGKLQFTRASGSAPGPMTRSPYNLPPYVVSSVPERWLYHPFGAEGKGIYVGAGLNGPGRGAPTTGAWNFDDLYIDYSWARVELCDTSDWATCRHREVQVPQQWADGQVVVDLNQGSFSPGSTVFLFVVDPDRRVSNPTALTLPSAGSPAPPTAPSSIRISQ
jgi:hypothetical protein